MFDISPPFLNTRNLWLIQYHQAFESQEFTSALAIAKLWVAAEESSPDAWACLAQSYAVKGNVPALLAALSNYINCSSNIAWALVESAKCQLYSDIPYLAETLLDRALQLQGVDAAGVCYLLRAEARMRLGDYSGALDDCQYVDSALCVEIPQKVCRASIAQHCAAMLRPFDHADETEDEA